MQSTSPLLENLLRLGIAFQRKKITLDSSLPNNRQQVLAPCVPPLSLKGRKLKKVLALA